VGLACRKSELGAAAREAKSVYEGRPGHGHIVIGGGVAAVSGTRAARHPERHAGQEAITAATLSEALARVWTVWHVGHGVFWVAAASRAKVRARATFRHERTHQFSERVRHSAS